MEEPNLEPEIKPQSPLVLSPSSSGRRSNNPNSPEFEFWRNPSLPQLNLHSADELFVDGIILPLCLLSHHSNESNPQQNPAKKPISDVTVTVEPELESGSTTHEPVSEPGPGPESSSSSTGFSSSKRWRDIFKVGDKKSSTSNQEDKGGGDKEKKDRKNNSGGTNNSAELNINIWPFSRSRSAGNSVNRPKMAVTRKVSSAPCSRSNSGGESKSKKQWPNSPSRGGGIHLGRSSPVWQVRRGGGNTGLKTTSEINGVKNADKAVKTDGSSVESRWSKSRLGGGGGVGVGLNLNVQMCMGYRQNSSCRSDDQNSSSSSLVGGEQSCSGGPAVNGGNGVKMFNLRTLFSKKVY